jgi:hypothetical protein
MILGRRAAKMFIAQGAKGSGLAPEERNVFFREAEYFAPLELPGWLEALVL